VTQTASPRTQTSPVRIKLKGSDLSPDRLAMVLDVTIEQDLVLPDAFTIRLHDTDQRPGQDEQSVFALLDDDVFPIGSEIAIFLGREESPEPILTGLITSLEVDARPDGAPIVVVRGYDQAYKLHRERKSRTFVNMNDADMARKIASEHGLSASVTSAGGPYDHVYQDNKTDWEFLRDRARRIGFELFVRDRTLTMRRPAAAGTVPQVEFLQTLLHLRLRLSAPRQVSEVVVKGWNPKTKQEVSGSASNPTQRPQIGEARSGSALASTLGTGRFLFTDPQVTTQDGATRMAQSLYDEIAGEFIQLEGTSLGDAGIRPGEQVQLNKVGRRFSGKYYVSGATHRHTAQDGYLTHFVVSGSRPLTITALLAGGGPGNGGSHQANGKGTGHSGVAVGIVTNNKPAEGVFEGQVKVKFPWLMGDNESAWARLATPMAGGNRGFFFLPEVGDEVLVAFEGGDINRPYVVGCLWNGRDAPPQQASKVLGSTNKVDRRVIASRLGHTITIDDSDSAPSITIVDKTAKNMIKIESTTNKLTASVEGDMILEAKGTVTIKGRTVDVQAQNDLKMKGVTADLEATNALTAKGVQTSIEGTARVNVKGAQGSVEGTATLEVKGGIVRIN
jgi:uncharacterized protein involved in type VI secretion and phage assembly